MVDHTGLQWFGYSSTPRHNRFGLAVSQAYYFLPSLETTFSLYRKPKRSKAPCLHYPNSCASRQVLLQGGDVATNPGPENSSSQFVRKSNVKCVLINARSLKSTSQTRERINQPLAFQKLVYENEYDVICVTESWLTEAIKDSEILDRGYNIFRCDRSGRLGGGVLIAMRESIACLRRSDSETQDLELVCIELNLVGSAKILLTTAYRTPDLSPRYDFEFIEKLSKFLSTSTRILRSSSIVLGDINYPCINWVEGCGISNSPNSADSAFCDRLRDFVVSVERLPDKRQ